MSKLAALRKIAAQPRDSIGRFASKGAAFARAHPDQAKDAIVNTGGFVASKAGMAVAGPIGALAGDLVGALVTRKAVADSIATYSAHEKLKHQKAYQGLTRLQKLKALREKAIEEAHAQKERTQDESLGDTIGWGVGNASANAIASAVPALAPIPFKGAVVAMATVPKLVKAKQRLVNHAQRRRSQSG